MVHSLFNIHSCHHMVRYIEILERTYGKKKDLRCRLYGGDWLGLKISGKSVNRRDQLRSVSNALIWYFGALILQQFKNKKKSVSRRSFQ